MLHHKVIDCRNAYVELISHIYKEYSDRGGVGDASFNDDRLRSGLAGLIGAGGWMEVLVFGLDIRLSASLRPSPQTISSGQIAQNAIGACSKSLVGEVK